MRIAYRVPVCMTESGARRVVPRRSMSRRRSRPSARSACSPRSRTTGPSPTPRLKYLDTAKGRGRPPTPGQTVNVHYTGWLEGFGDEGAKFDSSYDRRKRAELPGRHGPRHFGLGRGAVVDVAGHGAEGHHPADLGYGKRGAGGASRPIRHGTEWLAASG